MEKKWILPAVLAGIFFASCATVMPKVTPGMADRASARWPGTSLADLEKGRDILTVKCSACHASPHPRSRYIHEWEKTLDRMAPRAKLTVKEREILTRYLAVNAR